jgi:putative ABC transport system ATP-binding protein
MSSDLLARLSDVSKVFRLGNVDVTALSDVSVTIRSGELTLLMGPSGSGKSTLLAILMGLLRPTTGIAELCGVDISSGADRVSSEVRRKNVGLIFQHYNLFPALTALDNVIEPLCIKGFARKHATDASREILGELGLGRRLNHKPGQLSGGERQRVAIARALVGNPKLVAGDEPTAALDGATGIEIISILRRYITPERGMLIVTHDARLIQFADRILRIEDGRIACPSVEVSE